jgi:hypothetical protein
MARYVFLISFRSSALFRLSIHRHSPLKLSHRFFQLIKAFLRVLVHQECQRNAGECTEEYEVPSVHVCFDFRDLATDVGIAFG